MYKRKYENHHIENLKHACKSKQVDAPRKPHDKEFSIMRDSSVKFVEKTVSPTISIIVTTVRVLLNQLGQLANVMVQCPALSQAHLQSSQILDLLSPQPSACCHIQLPTPASGRNS